MDIQQLQEHKFIVLCTEHYTPLGVIRGLGEAGIRPIGIVVKEKHNKVASASKYLDRVIFVTSEQEQFDTLLREFGNETIKPMVYPCDDKITELVDEHYDEIKDKFFISNAAQAGRIAFYQNKDNINQLAQKYGLNVAKTWRTKKGVIPEGIIYPIITKTISSNVGSWKKDYYICHNEDELKEAYEKIQATDLLLQQYITKENELCLDGVSVCNGKCVLHAISSRYTYILPDYYSSEMVIRNFYKEPKYEETKKALDGMFAEIGYDGVYSVEFLIDRDGTLWFLEINFRTSTWNYAATALGMNLPVLWAYGQLNGKLPEDAEKEIPEGYRAMAELPDLGWRVMKGRISFREWLKAVRACDCFYFYNKKGKKPFYTAVYWKIRNKVVKKLKRKSA